MIPFSDLKKNYQNYSTDLNKAILNVCENGSYILGPQVTNFEKKFAGYIGSKFAIGVGNGTDALKLSCKALEIGEGDEVLVPANTFIASATGIYELGAKIVPVDINTENYLIDLKDAEKRITEKTKLIIPVHLYGQSIDMDQLMDFSEKHNLSVIEDSCQSHGSKWKNKRTGSFGISGCFSFYPSKNLGSFGDGGMIVTDDEELAEKLYLLRNLGSKNKYIHEIWGVNSRLDSIQAAVLDCKLQFLDTWNKKRFDAAIIYSELLKDLKNIELPNFDLTNNEKHVFHLFVIRAEKRDELLEYLNSKEIQAGIHYPIPLYRHKAFQLLNISPEEYPNTEIISNEIISLPMFPEITYKQINEITDVIKEFYGK